MNDLRQLIGEKVTAMIGEDENGHVVEMECKITDLYIDNYYFEEKNEPIYITVNVEPLQDMGEDFNWDKCNEISLEYIRR